MRAASNNHYQAPLPFSEVKVHSSKQSEEDTGYDSFPNPTESKARISSTAGLSSSSSSSNNQFDRIMNLVKSLPSPTDLSTTPESSEMALSVAQRIAQFSKHANSVSLPSNPNRKIHRTRVQPLPDSTSDSTDSLARSNHLVLVSSMSKPIIHATRISSLDLPPLTSNLEYVHDDRFDSTTTVDHVKNDVIAIEFMEQHPTNSTSQVLFETKASQPPNLSLSSLIQRFGESLRLLPPTVLATIFLSLTTGLVLSALIVLIIA